MLKNCFDHAMDPGCRTVYMKSHGTKVGAIYCNRNSRNRTILGIYHRGLLRALPSSIQFVQFCVDDTKLWIGFIVEG